MSVDLISPLHRPTLSPTASQRCGPGWRSAPGLLLMLAAMIGLSGCVTRRLTVHSDPPGALVMLEGKEIGYTPCAVDFTYYATRNLTLVKDGYETLNVQQKVSAPWYQWPGVEIISDNFLFTRITDRHLVSYRMQPKLIVPNTELLQRGEQLRNEAHIGP